MAELFRFNTHNLSENIQKILMSHPLRARRAMDAVGGYLNGETKKRTPILEGFLTADVSNKTVTYKKSFAAVVYVPSNATSAKYAIPMHENKYHLGKKSMQKRRKTGSLVGRKYITRALFDNVKTIRAIIKDELGM